MKRHVVYFIDEDPAARRANGRELTKLIDNAEIKVVAKEPLKTFAEYNSLVAAPSTAAFILDQRMKASGLVGYNGTELAAYLRGIEGKMPIYILTGFIDHQEDFVGSRHLVEDIIAKDDIEFANSENAKIIKARLLRHLEVFNDVRDNQEQRFHDLLVKSLSQTLTPEEEKEMNEIDGDTAAPVLAAERAKARELDERMEQLRKILDRGPATP